MTSEQCLYLALLGVMFAVFHIVHVYRRSHLTKVEKEFFEEHKKRERFLDWGQDICGMVFAWCLYFSIFEFYTSHVFDLDQKAVASVVTALSVTMLAIGLVYALDKIADLPETGEEVDKSIRSFMFAISILIGFSWE